MVFSTVFFGLSPTVNAAFAKGTAEVNLHWVKGQTSPSFTFIYNNPGDSEAALCIRIDRPSAQFTLTGGSSSGWVESHTSSRVEFTGGSLPAGGSGSFVVTSTVLSNSAQSAWTVWGSKNLSCNPSSKASASSAGALDTGIDGTAPINNGLNSVTADSPTQITVVANAATDSGGGLNSTPYYFEETSGTGHNSDWQASNTFVDSALSPNIVYSYRLRVRDVFDNQSDWSAIGSARTEANPPTNGSFSDIKYNSITISWGTNLNPVGTEYYAENQTAGANSGWTTATSWISSGLLAETSHSFRIKARNADGVETAWYNAGSQSTSAAPVNPPEPPPPPPPPEPPKVPGTIAVDAVPEPVGPTPTAPAIAPPLFEGEIGSPGTTIADLSIFGGTTSLRPIKASPGDVTPPTIEIVQKQKGVIKDSVFSLSANARDIEGVIEFLAYSIDGGKAWQPVTITGGSKIGTAQVTFLINSFRLPDGNYEILLKARDNSENETILGAGILVLDVEQPQIISLLVRSGSLEIPSAMPTEVTLSAKLDFEVVGIFAGGVTKGKIVIDNKDYEFIFDKEKNNWTSKIRIDTVGKKNVNVYLYDGADNLLQEEIFSFNVVDPLAVDVGDKQKITIFEFNFQNDAWQVFNAESYQKSNPAEPTLVDQNGIILPAGKYYIKSGENKKQNLFSRLMSYFSNVFEIDDTQSLSGNTENVSVIKPEDITKYPSVASAKILDNMPEVKNQLLALRGNDIVSFNFDPRSFVSLEQLSVLSEVQKTQPDLKIFATTNKYYLEYCQQMLQRGDYQVELISVDNNYFYKDIFKYRSPGFIFINRRGEVKMIKTGYLTKQEITDIIGGM